MLQAETATLSALLREATDRLSAAGSDSARAEAERLAANALGVDWGDLWPMLRDHVSEEAEQGIARHVARRAAGEPLAYIIGSTVFYGREIDCGPGVLVPRPETETLVDIALELVADVRQPRVVDVGTGTGAIAVAIAAERPGADVCAIDKSTDALNWAERNIAKLGADVHVLSGDLLEPLPSELRGTFDLVVSNPPYIATTAKLPPDVLAEPEIALFAGADGMEVVRRLVGEAPGWLREGGALALEVGTPEQARALSASLVDWRAVAVRNDHTGRPRVVSARR